MYPSLLPFAPFIGAKNYPFSHEYALRNKHLPFSEMRKKWLEEEAYTPEKRDGISIFNHTYSKYIRVHKKGDLIRYILFYKKLPDLEWEISEKYTSTREIKFVKNSRFNEGSELYGQCIGILKTTGVIKTEVLSHPPR